MIHKAPDALEVECEEAYVVYDPNTGDVAHVHRAYTHRGAEKLPTGEAGAARALELAAKFGHRTDGLRVLPVTPQELNLPGPKRVDVKSGKLVIKRLVTPSSGDLAK